MPQPKEIMTNGNENQTKDGMWDDTAKLRITGPFVSCETNVNIEKDKRFEVESATRDAAQD